MSEVIGHNDSEHEEKAMEATDDRYAHMCRDEHVEIGHNDSERERCPLCLMTDERDALKAELAEMTDERDAWQKAQQESFAAAAANADTCARLQAQDESPNRLVDQYRIGLDRLIDQRNRIVGLDLPDPSCSYVRDEAVLAFDI